MRETPDRSAVVRRLRTRLREMQRAEGRSSGAAGPSSTGIGALDALLVPGVFRPGMIVEWVAAGAGSGMALLAAAMAARALQAGGALVVIDERREFYPPAALHLGLNLQRTIIIHPRNHQETAWALEQTLRCGGAAVTLAWVERLSDRLCRRLQLAAEQGARLGLLLRSAPALRAPCWADLRWFVQPVPMPARGSAGEEAGSPATAATTARHDVRSRLSGPPGRRVRVELLHCREGTPGGAVELEIDDETGAVRVVSPVAAATGASRAARA